MFKNKVFKEVLSYIYMTIGLFIFVSGWTMFLIPVEIAGGGVAGLASVVYYATGMPVSYTYIIINGFLLIVGVLSLGKSFGFKTIYCVAVSALMFNFLPDLISWTTDISDNLINSLIGGTLSGIGIGIIFLNGGSTGGTDIIALIISKYRETSPGRVFIICDFIIIGSIYFLPEKQLQDMIYGYIEMISFSYIIDMIITGNRQSVQVLIFSNRYQDIADEIVSGIGRGVTALDSLGWYTQNESKVLCVVIRKHQLAQLSKTVKEIDHQAFMSVSSVMSVYGQGFDKFKVGTKWNIKAKQSSEV